MGYSESNGEHVKDWVVKSWFGELWSWKLRWAIHGSAKLRSSSFGWLILVSGPRFGKIWVENIEVDDWWTRVTRLWRQKMKNTYHCVYVWENIKKRETTKGGWPYSKKDKPIQCRMFKAKTRVRFSVKSVRGLYYACSLILRVIACRAWYHQDIRKAGLSDVHYQWQI